MYEYMHDVYVLIDVRILGKISPPHPLHFPRWSTSNRLKERNYYARNIFCVYLSTKYLQGKIPSALSEINPKLTTKKSLRHIIAILWQVLVSFITCLLKVLISLAKVIVE